MKHLPATGKPVPVSTYRVQLRPPAEGHPGFGFADAAAVVPYLAELGVTHLYCSPILQAAPGSAHGYDVVDHSRISDDLGGAAAFDDLAAACRAAGLGLVVDVVPNHMSIAEPESQNAQWWSVLRDGPASPYAEWFDIDWNSRDNPGKVLMPILGAPLGEVLDELKVEDDTVRYYDHVLPLAPGSVVPGDIGATLERQHYRLCHWKVAGEELNYRRFFDVTTLAGVRVEFPGVFDATHAVLLAHVRSGAVDGLRIDHPDGLADPGGYLDRLADETDGAWVVVEKILESGERLPAEWACAGTTGYDALNRVLGLFVDPAGELPLTSLWESVTASRSSYDEIVLEAKRLILSDVLAAEVNRLTDVGLAACAHEPALRDTTRRGLRDALVEVLAAFGVYRAYLSPDGPADGVAREHIGHALDRAKATTPDRADEIELVGRLALAEGPRNPAAQEFVTRFQQTCGPVMAKGVEDTAFYRYLRLTALNEVGGDPGRFGRSTQEFHDACLEMSEQWSASMTALSTHDTKRSEDVRARLVLLSQCPTAWGEVVTRWSALAARHRRPGGPDAATEQLLWQTLVGAWPLDADRLVAYLRKATREAKARTSWLAPDEAFEAAVAEFARAVLADDAIVRDVEAFVQQLQPGWHATSLAQKLVQLTMPGVADTYQGTELIDLSLVDPDNRRPVDFDRRRELLSAQPVLADVGSAKLHVVAQTLRLRREHPDWFLTPNSYRPLDAGARALAFERSGQVVTVVPLRAFDIATHGWGDDAVALPEGAWHNVLTGERVTSHRLADLLATFPVALLVRAA
ncbi:MAG: (1-_4)-alpha-D-glucan 1-alpha-D-glucosylmutase [Actinomycetota bacterium]|jgi:(1->4)-alpha-D-glucan 1-alpha-D-glucosylmutase|nr:(1->4)-alpha-D-glucan 1-alpha-D-glucosylmutase [Actinomycetota bacterium]